MHFSQSMGFRVKRKTNTCAIYKHKLKQLGTPYIKELIKCHKTDFVKVEDAAYALEEFKDTDVIDQAFDKSGKIIALLTKMAFTDFDLLERVLLGTAYDPKSMDGIATKIIKNKK